MKLDLYPTTRGWFQEQVRDENSLLTQKARHFESLFVCFEELKMTDAEALSFCARFVSARTFWIEWEILEEPTTGGNPRVQKRALISTAINGGKTILLNHNPPLSHPLRATS
jgi:hypothetical protein